MNEALGYGTYPEQKLTPRQALVKAAQRPYMYPNSHSSPRVEWPGLLFIPANGFVPTAVDATPPPGSRRAAAAKLEQLQRSIAAEQGRKLSKRADLQSALSWMPHDLLKQHDPAGMPFRRPT
jgi:hypothetical protein